MLIHGVCLMSQKALGTATHLQLLQLFSEEIPNCALLPLKLLGQLLQGSLLTKNQESPHSEAKKTSKFRLPAIFPQKSGIAVLHSGLQGLPRCPKLTSLRWKSDWPSRLKLGRRGPSLWPLLHCLGSADTAFGNGKPLKNHIC